MPGAGVTIVMAACILMLLSPVYMPLLKKLFKKEAKEKEL